MGAPFPPLIKLVFRKPREKSAEVVLRERWSLRSCRFSLSFYWDNGRGLESCRWYRLCCWLCGTVPGMGRVTWPSFSPPPGSTIWIFWIVPELKRPVECPKVNIVLTNPKVSGYDPVTKGLKIPLKSRRKPAEHVCFGTFSLIITSANPR